MRTLVIGGGKGGVGKSTIAANLAVAAGRAGFRVGLLDADVHGPNIPRMFGVTRLESPKAWDLARADRKLERFDPLRKYGISLMSTGLLLGDADALTVAPGFLELMTAQLLGRVDWGDLDLLVIDLPPGGGSVHETVLRHCPGAGAVVVTTPERVSHMDGRRAVSMFRATGLEVIGAVENRASHACPDCGKAIVLHPRTRDAETIWALDVARLASVPFDLEAAESAESGVPAVVAAPTSPFAIAVSDLAKSLL